LNHSEPLPAVSIIIPCYNAQAYVGEAIQSALDQTYPNKEVIVIDDGSTDGSLEVIRSFGDRIRWETGPNRGGCAARNRGIELARGELIQFLDADDLLHADKLTKTVQVAEEQRVDSVLSDVLVVSETGHVTRWSPSCWDDPVVSALGAEVGTCGHLHRRALLMRIGGFRKGLPCAQERDLHIRMACAGGTIGYLPEVLATVRRQRGSVSANSVRVLDQYAGIIQPAYESLLRASAMTERRARAFAGFMARAARGYLADNEPEKARVYFEMARSLHPQGGLDEAYRGWSRFACRWLGPVRTEAMLRVKRRIGDCVRKRR